MSLPQYSFPLLSNAEILLVFRELQLATQLTDAELQGPEKSATRIRSLLEALGTPLLESVRKSLCLSRAVHWDDEGGDESACLRGDVGAQLSRPSRGLYPSAAFTARLLEDDGDLRYR